MQLEEFAQPILSRHGVSFAAVVGQSQSKNVSAARRELMYQIYINTRYSVLVVGQIFNRCRTAASNAILAYAHSIGLSVSNIKELRGEPSGAKFIDWVKFANAIAHWLDKNEFTDQQGAHKAGLSRSLVRNARNGKTLTADSFLGLCLAAQLPPFDYILPEYLKNNVSHDTRCDVKHHPITAGYDRKSETPKEMRHV